MSELLRQVHWNFSRRNNFWLKKSAITFFWNWRRKLWDFGQKKSGVVRKNFHESWENYFRFTEKNVRVNRIMFWKEISFNEIIRPEQKIQIFYRSPFSVLLSEDYASFLEEVWRQNFFVKKVFFLFLFHQTVLGPLRKYFLQWC